MAPERQQEEVTVRRIIACFAPGSAVAPAAVAELAKQMQAELLGLFIEDIELLRFAALPFAVEVGHASALPRALDLAAVERALRAQADSLRQVLSAALDPSAHAWSFRVARSSPADAIQAALAEGFAPSLLLPPGVHPHAEPRVVRKPDLSASELRALLATARPVLVLPE
jgi:hypothetical protein